MNSETGTDVAPNQYGLVGLVLIFMLCTIAVLLARGTPTAKDAYKEKVPPTEAERFISGEEALIKDGVRVWIHTDKYYNLKEYTRRGYVPGLTEVYDRLRVRGYLTPHELALSGPYSTPISCGLGRFNGDFSLECTQLVSIEDPKNYMGMRMDLKTYDHLGEGVDRESFQVAFAKAVKALSQANLGTLPTVK